MKSFLRRHKVVSAVLLCGCLFGLFFAWEVCSEVRGRLVAHFDLARGHIMMAQLGEPLPRSFQAEYLRLLHERYGVEVRYGSGWTASAFLIYYCIGYTDVMVKAAKQKFGHDIFIECLQEAARNSRARKARR